MPTRKSVPTPAQRAAAATPALQWGLSLQGPSPADLARWIAALAWAGRTPVRLSVNYEKLPAGADWLRTLCAGTEVTRAAFFDDEAREELVVHRGGTVSCHFDGDFDPPQALATLASAPFEVASFETLHPQWRQARPPYVAPGLGSNHFALGWGCALRGAGHERLVSPRWLEHGPWRLHRGKGDLRLVQFHAWAAPAAQALKQAKPGHRALGIGDESGYIADAHVFKHGLSGLYDDKLHMLRIVRTDGPPPAARELLDAAAALRQGALTPRQPLKRVAYVFPDPAAARAALHAIWLRGLECWTVIDGKETRLDTDHAPTPAPPAWTRGE